MRRRRGAARRAATAGLGALLALAGPADRAAATAPQIAPQAAPLTAPQSAPQAAPLTAAQIAPLSLAQAAARSAPQPQPAPQASLAPTRTPTPQAAPAPAPWTAPTPRAALLAPGERLRVYALGRATERAGDPALAEILAADLARLGFGAPEDGPLRERRLSVAPVLGWDSNLNGGLPNGALDLPGLTLVATPESRAKAGLAGGGRVDGGLRLGLAEGVYLDADAELEAVWSPRHEVHRATAFGALCARGHLGGWRFGDLCWSGAAIDRDLGRTETSELSLGGAALFETPHGVHEAGLALARRDIEGGVQPALTAHIATVTGPVAGRFALSLGAPVEDALAQRWRLAADLRAAPFGRPAILRATVEAADGERLFGMERRDGTIGAALVLPLWDGGAVEIGLARTDSTIDLFDETRFGVRLLFAPLF